MFKATYVNHNRRDLLKQLVTAGIVLAGTGSLSTIAKPNLAKSRLQITRRGDEDYATLRRFSVWRSNLPDRYPDIIAQADNKDDIVEALAFARKNDLQIVCRATGHNNASAPLRNGGMMLYLNGLNDIDINPSAKTATFQPSVNMTTLLAEAQKHGLDFPTADCATVGMTGFILGGGLGRHSNYLTHGPACNALVSAEVLLANGERIIVDKDHYPDIFWAMRGCGPAFFGIVMSMTVRLFESRDAYLVSNYTFPAESLSWLIDFFDKRQCTHNPRVDVWIYGSVRASEGNAITLNVRLTTYATGSDDPEKEARSLLEYYTNEGLAEYALEKSEYLPMETDDIMYATSPARGVHVDNICTDDALSMLAAFKHLESCPDGINARLILTHNTQSLAPLTGDICYTAGGNHFLGLYTNWSNLDNTQNAYEWVDGFSEIVKPFGQGHYLNQINSALYPDKARLSFSEENWKRIKTLRSKYDPENRFFTYVGQEENEVVSQVRS